MNRRGWWTVVLAGWLTGLAACGRTNAPDPTAEAPSAPAPTRAAESAVPEADQTFAMIPKQKDNPVFAYARQAAEQRAEELGVELLWDGPPSNDPAAQASLIETFVSQGVDGIAVSASNPETLKRAIDKAVEAGVPVVTWDSDAPNSQRAAFYGIDDEATGRMLGEELVALLPEGGKVAILSGVPGAENLERRVRGARAVLEAADGIEVLPVVYGDDDIPRSVEAIADTMAEHPDLAGWVLVGGWPLFARNGLDAVEPGRTKVVAVDPLPETWPWIEDGHVQVIVGQKVFGWGRESVNLLHALATGQPIDADENGFVDSGVDIVVPEATGRYADERYTPLAAYREQFEAAGAR